MADIARHNNIRFDAILGAEIARTYKPAPSNPWVDEGTPPHITRIRRVEGVSLSTASASASSAGR
ncbi:MAG: hypothetical protein HYZ58_00930 [Acidobacteria bacterium]|nr:hypothetical protein [Acidobacteriota bacterium]